jgi:hypothetical protein
MRLDVKIGRQANKRVRKEGLCTEILNITEVRKIKSALVFSSSVADL